MKKFKNIKTGNVIRVKDEFAKLYETSKQYEEVVDKAAKKPEK